MRRVLAFALTVVFCMSCATIIGKSQHPVKFSSNPDGAEVTITNRAGETVFTGKTPTIVVLKSGCGFFKGEEYIATFCKDGCYVQKAEVKRGVSGWYIAGNLVFGGLIGWLIVDPATGAMWTLEDVHANLEQVPQPPTDQSSSLYIVSLEQVPISMKPNMVRIGN